MDVGEQFDCSYQYNNCFESCCSFVFSQSLVEILSEVKLFIKQVML